MFLKVVRVNSLIVFFLAWILESAVAKLFSLPCELREKDGELESITIREREEGGAEGEKKRRKRK